MAKGLRKMILEQVAPRTGTELAKKTWENTKDELEKGWLDESKDSSGIILATRFGLERKTKLRVIDDGRRTPVFPRRSKHWVCF